jgi:hypothetical protein
MAFASRYSDSEEKNSRGVGSELVEVEVPSFRDPGLLRRFETRSATSPALCPCFVARRVLGATDHLLGVELEVFAEPELLGRLGGGRDLSLGGG